jgi:hypothetical protein
MRDRHKGKLPMKAPGCPLEMWSGVIGISDKLVVFDGGIPIAGSSALSVRGRRALAAHMVDLWTRFGRCEAAESDAPEPLRLEGPRE